MICVPLPLLSPSRGVSEIMGSSTEGMGITFVYWIQSALQDVPVWAFIVAAVIAYILVGLLPLGTSSASGITMPVLGAVAMAFVLRVLRSVPRPDRCSLFLPLR